jgi:hypothetical protein
MAHVILVGGVGILAAYAQAADPEFVASTTTLAVGYRSEPRAGSLLLRTSGGEIRVTVRPIGDRVSAVTLDAAGGSAAPLDEARTALLADPDVRYAYPARVHAASGQIVLPTDQILMKVRPGIDVSEVTRRLPPTLSIVRPLQGADDEYVLRLVDPRSDDPFSVAAALARMPWVQWAEPDLVREYVR